MLLHPVEQWQLTSVQRMSQLQGLKLTSSSAGCALSPARRRAAATFGGGMSRADTLRLIEVAWVVRQASA